jgi:hypothetical protein
MPLWWENQHPWLGLRLPEMMPLIRYLPFLSLSANSFSRFPLTSGRPEGISGEGIGFGFAFQGEA